MNERKPLRLYFHNYSKPRSYFVTIKLDCDLKFGNIINKKVQLNELGIIANNCWSDIPIHFEDCVLDEYVIMPDHIHGIIKIISLNDVGDRYICPQKDKISSENRYICPQKDKISSKNRYICPQKDDNKDQNEKNAHSFTDADPRRHVQKLPLVIGTFKAAVSRKLHKIGYGEFQWQRSYNDRIIRKNELKRFRTYIKRNPIEWETEEI